MPLTFLLASLSLILTEPVATRDPVDLPVPFDRYFTQDEFGREITWYLSHTRSKKVLPLIVFIQGSGNVSHFSKQKGQIAGGLQMPLLAAAKGRARILIVEKPGVRYLELPR